MEQRIIFELQLERPRDRSNECAEMTLHKIQLHIQLL